MSSCKFPQHHESARSGSGLAVAGVVALVLVVIWIRRHVGELVHWAVVVAVVLVAAAAVVLAVRWLVSRSGKSVTPGAMDLPRGSTIWLRHVPRAAWCALRWHALTRNLALAYPDRHRKGKTRRPRAVILPTAHGVVAWVRTVPGCGRKEFDQDAQHIADAWRVSRVSVSQTRPGRLRVSGLVRDPLLQSFGIVAAPPGTYDGRFTVPRLWLGRAEDAADLFLDLPNVSGCVMAGLPGAGKSVEITNFLMQFCPSPAVQIVTLDGKGGSEFEEFTDRCWMSGGLSLTGAVAMLEELVSLMESRLACVRARTGRKNIWDTGISVEWPLVAVVIDECQRYLDITAVRGDKEAEKLVARCIALVADLMRRGRSAGMFTLAATQKATTDACPSVVRDNAAVAVAFALKTNDAAVAILGPDIRDFDSYSPVAFRDRSYAGCGVVTLASGQDPFTRFRAPLVTEDQAAEVAAASAHLRRDPAALLAPVPDDASQLTAAVPSPGGRHA